MDTVATSEPRIIHLKVTNQNIIAQLADGRSISVPLVWSWRLSEATPAQRNHFDIMGSGQGVYWPDLDEDLSAIGMLTGVPARRPKSASKDRARQPASATRHADLKPETALRADAARGHA